MDTADVHLGALLGDLFAEASLIPNGHRKPRGEFQRIAESARTGNPAAVRVLLESCERWASYRRLNEGGPSGPGKHRPHRNPLTTRLARVRELGAEVLALPLPDQFSAATLSMMLAREASARLKDELMYGHFNDGW